MIADIERDGVAVAPPMVGAQETLAYLSSRPTYSGHVKGASVSRRNEGSSTCWTPDDVLGAPHFWEFALGMTDVARGYLGPNALLYSVNAFTTYPTDGPMNPDIQAWHRDKDDVKFLALFVYLTDVSDRTAGAHLYRAGTHHGGAKGEEISVLGPAGTAFLADGRGLHMGVRPATKPRTMAWARWCVSDPPPSYVWDKITPCDRAVLGDRYPADASLRGSVRLVVS